MAENKHALLRYETLDRCLANRQGKYHSDELLRACKDAVDETFGEGGVSRRQLYLDLKYLEEHYQAPIERIQDGHQVVLRYSDPDFSIRKRPLSQNDVAQLQNTLSLLHRFKGMPQFEWIEEITNKLAVEFKLDNRDMSIVGFEQNAEGSGLQYFTPILEAITAKHAITFRYKPFTMEERVVTMSPHFLKQYNRRWYVLGHEAGIDYVPNYALDRIKGSMRIASSRYVESDLDYNEDFFADIVGVTHYRDGVKERIVLQVDDDFIGYFESKPIHDSLKPVKGQPGYYTLDVIYNLELANAIFTHLDKIRIVSEETGQLTKELKRRLSEAGKKMGDDI